MKNATIERIIDGRTDLVFEHLGEGGATGACDASGVALIKWCAYFGDVSAIKLLLSKGESIEALGENFDLAGAAFHGHWQLCQFLIEHGANVNFALTDTGETSLHAALGKANSLAHDHVVSVLLAAGADPNHATKNGVKTGAFMRDVGTRAETPLHRAAAFGSEATLDRLLAAGARIDAEDAHGESPLSWASWHLRSVSILRKLCYGEFNIHPDYIGMQANLLGRPHATSKPPLK